MGANQLKRDWIHVGCLDSCSFTEMRARAVSGYRKVQVDCAVQLRDEMFSLVYCVFVCALI